MKKLTFIIGAAITALALGAVTSCDMKLDDEDDRAAIASSTVTDIVPKAEVLTEKTAVSDISAAKELTLIFHCVGSVADDQFMFFKGERNSKTVSVRSGYLGDWQAWDEGFNDGMATGGTAKGTVGAFCKVFTGDDTCVFVFSPNFEF